MTDAQIAAIHQIRDITREHFDASVVIVSGTAVGEDEAGTKLEDTAVDIEYIFHGGYATSIGLVELAKLHVYKRGVDSSSNEFPVP